jgi:hypothetical protein
MDARHRVLRKYRNLAPGPFHVFNQKVMNGLTNNPSIPDSVWVTNPTLLPSYLSTSQKQDSAYHEAIYGGKLAQTQRDLLQAQLIEYLDEIAVLLELAALRNPEVLITSGFELAKERRSTPRVKAAPAAAEDAKASDSNEPSH